MAPCEEKTKITSSNVYIYPNPFRQIAQLNVSPPTIISMFKIVSFFYSKIIVKSIYSLSLIICSISNCFYGNSHTYPNGCVGVANAGGPSLLTAGGLHHTVFQLQWKVFKSIFAIVGLPFIIFLPCHKGLDWVPQRRTKVAVVLKLLFDL